MKKWLVIFVLVLLLGGCTDNQQARVFGGKFTVDLPKGQKLINATWKDTDLWYLTRTMTAKDSAQTYQFKEKSTWGALEGEITFVEHK